MGTTPNNAGSFHDGAPIPQEVILYGANGKPISSTNPLDVNVDVTVQPAANQRVNAQSGDFVAGSIVDLTTLPAGLAELLTDTDNLATILTQLTTLAGIVSSAKAAVKAGAGDFADLATIAAAISAGRMLTTETNSASIKSDLDTIAGAVASTLMQINLSKVGGNSVATGNNAVPILNTASAGAVAAYGSNAAATTGGSDYQFKWGGGGTTQVNHVMLQNNTGANVSWDDSAATTAGSAILATGQTLFLDVQTANFHVQTSGNQNVGGSSANNLIIKGWL